MPVYRYTAMDINSKKKSGKAEANSREELVALLRLEDLYLLNCQVKVEEQVKYKFKLNQLSELCREIGTMLASGISLIRAMDIIARREPNPKVRSIYKDIYVKLQQGFSLSQALEAQTGAFPDIMVNMFRAAESTGLMDKTALKLGDQFEKDHKLQNKVMSAMLYPIILLVVTIFVLIAVFTVILPTFFDMFEGVDIPLITQIMFGISKLLIQHWVWFLIGTLLIISAISFAMRLETVRYKWDRFKLKVPKVRNLVRIIYTARFARSMSSLYSSGVSMLNSLMLAKTTINNKYLELQFDDVIKEVRNGSTLSRAVSKIDGFDEKLVTAIYMGEESGRLDDMLENTANDFDFAAEVATERLVTLLQPLMIVILGLVIGMVIVSVLLPVYSLYGSVGAG